MIAGILHFTQGLSHWQRSTNILSEPREKVEALSNQYTSVFTKQPTGNLPNIEGKPETPMSDFEFTSNGTEKLLKTVMTLTKEMVG
jgi:hypothetical protein